MIKEKAETLLWHLFARQPQPMIAPLLWDLFISWLFGPFLKVFLGQTTSMCLCQCCEIFSDVIKMLLDFPDFVNIYLFIKAFKNMTSSSAQKICAFCVCVVLAYWSLLTPPSPVLHSHKKINCSQKKMPNQNAPREKGSFAPKAALQSQGKRVCILVWSLYKLWL